MLGEPKVVLLGVRPDLGRCSRGHVGGNLLDLLGTVLLDALEETLVLIRGPVPRLEIFICIGSIFGIPVGVMVRGGIKKEKREKKKKKHMRKKEMGETHT